MACDTIKIETLDADEVVSIVTAGPQGPSGSEAATLTTTGDMLYRAALANDRLPIGSEGQVLKVSSGLPAWGNESGAVTSVNGETGAVTLTKNEVGYTITNEEIDSTNSAAPTVIAASPYYSASRGGIDVGIMLWSETENSYGHVTLPILAANEIGRVTVRLSLQGGAPTVSVKITLANQEATPVWPLSGYDQLALDQDYTFRWNGDRWELDILSDENATSTASLFRPDYNGTLVGWRGAVPATPTSPGSPGQLAYGYQDGADRLYICVANNTWRRIPIATW